MSLNRIKSALGPKGWLDDEGDTLKYRTDWRGGSVADALGVARPADTATAAAVIRLAREAGIALVPQGGNTGLVLGSIPTEARPTIILSTDRLTRVRELDAGNYALVAEAGCVVAHLQACAAEVGRLLPLSLASEGSCTIGGALSTNAGGNQTIRFGNTREQILGLEVVLPDGTVLDGLNTLRKNNTGYDLKHLFIGAEGTLGVITGAVLKLYPAPQSHATAMVGLASAEAALALFIQIRAVGGDNLTAFEILNHMAMGLVNSHIPGTRNPFTIPHAYYALVELSSSRTADNLRALMEICFENALDEGIIDDAVIAESAEQAARLWRLRESIPEAQVTEGASIKHDISVPVSKVPDFIKQANEEVAATLAETRVVAFGHMGDGNLHYNLTFPKNSREDNDEDGRGFLGQWGAFNRVVHDIAVSMGGSFSAEHGIGQLKRTELGRYGSPLGISMMRGIKAALDPQGIMNPGKVIPD